MKDLINLLVWVLFGMMAWATIAFSVAWWRTRQAVCVQGGLIYALMTIVVMRTMMIANPHSRIVLLSVIALGSNLIIPYLTLVIQGIYRTPWDLMVFRHPRRVE